MRNAFYSRASKSIQFYYFYKDGKRVNTCLSHYIIAHEPATLSWMGSARISWKIAQSVYSAFHEFTANLTAILAAFLNNTLRLQPAQASGGDMSHDQIISGLAEEFGYYSYRRFIICAAQIIAWI